MPWDNVFIQNYTCAHQVLRQIFGPNRGGKQGDEENCLENSIIFALCQIVSRRMNIFIYCLDNSYIHSSV